MLNTEACMDAVRPQGKQIQKKDEKKSKIEKVVSVKPITGADKEDLKKYLSAIYDLELAARREIKQSYKENAGLTSNLPIPPKTSTKKYGDSNNFFYIALMFGKVIGAAQCVKTPFTGTIALQWLTVATEQQGKQVAPLLLAEVIADVKKRGFKTLLTTTVKGDAKDASLYSKFKDKAIISALSL